MAKERRRAINASRGNSTLVRIIMNNKSVGWRQSYQVLIKQGAGVERGTDGGWILEDEDHLPSSALGFVR